MKVQHNPTWQHKRNLHALAKLAIAITALFITAPIVFSIMFGKGAEIFPTTLTLQNESCNLLHQEGIAIKGNFTTDNICTLNVAYRYNRIGNGGTIYLEDGALNIAGDQVVATELMDEQSAIQSRMDDLVMILASTGFLLGTLIWLSLV